jgi:ABC-type Mn2+/Zn2+ transport system ATPase subunit
MSGEGHRCCEGHGAAHAGGAGAAGGPHERLILENVTVCYRRRPAVHHVSAVIHCHAMTALVGPNGAGKSTLLRAIMGWHQLTTGSIRIGSTHSREILPRLAYLPQRLAVDWDFPATVQMVVEQGRYPAIGLFRRFRGEDRERVEGALEELGLTSVRERQIGELSGGQQQRVFLARAVAQGADIFLLDEPFAGLDERARDDLLRRLDEWRGQGRTVVAAVHDLTVCRERFTEALLLKTHLVASGPAREVLTPERVAEAFGGVERAGWAEECGR